MNSPTGWRCGATGGEVHQVGVSLLLLTPAPFVDASAASAFRHASQRLMP
jgi:putative peptide zinc metalloprotease protein